MQRAADSTYMRPHVSWRVRWACRQEIAQRKQRRLHPLTNRLPRQHLVHEQRGRLGHPSRTAARARPAALAAGCNELLGMTGLASDPKKACFESAALQIRLDLRAASPPRSADPEISDSASNSRVCIRRIGRRDCNRSQRTARARALSENSIASVARPAGSRVTCGKPASSMRASGPARSPSTAAGSDSIHSVPEQPARCRERRDANDGRHEEQECAEQSLLLRRRQRRDHEPDAGRGEQEQPYADAKGQEPTAKGNLEPVPRPSG